MRSVLIDGVFSCPAVIDIVLPARLGIEWRVKNLALDLDPSSLCVLGWLPTLCTPADETLHALTVYGRHHGTISKEVSQWAPCRFKYTPWIVILAQCSNCWRISTSPCQWRGSMFVCDCNTVISDHAFKTCVLVSFAYVSPDWFVCLISLEVGRAYTVE